MFIVYKITNRINGKIYIGLTGHSFERRWKEHINSAVALNDKYVFHKALRKYGEDAFNKEILFTNLTKSEAQLKERELIAQYNTYYLQGNGYNMTYGGECNDHKKGELGYGARLTNKAAAKVRELLKDHSLSYSDIAKQLDLELSESTRSLIGRINSGTSYCDDKEKYPIRADGRSIGGPRRRREKNPASKLTTDKVLLIIKDLESTLCNQETIAIKYGVSRSLVNIINRCKIWQELHSYKKNIRKEAQNNIKYAPQIKQRKYTKEQVLLAVDLLHNSDLGLKTISEKTGITVSSIENINMCRIWRDIHPYTGKIRTHKKGVKQ